MLALYDSDVMLVLMLLQKQLQLFINFCSQSSLNSANDCRQTERQIKQYVWGCARTARVSQQCLHENCTKMVGKKQWPYNSSNLNGMEISCLGSDA